MSTPTIFEYKFSIRQVVDDRGQTINNAYIKLASAQANDETPTATIIFKVSQTDAFELNSTRTLSIPLGADDNIGRQTLLGLIGQVFPTAVQVYPEP